MASYSMNIPPPTSAHTQQDPSNPAGDYGRSDFDRRSVFNASVVYAIPFFHSTPRALNDVFSNWQASSIIGVSSGLPFPTAPPAQMHRSPA